MAAGATYEPIATTTVAVAAASLTFSSIPSTYTDLRIVLTATSVAGGNPDVYMRFNGDSGTNYSNTLLGGNGTSATTGGYTSTAVAYIDTTGISTTNPHVYSVDVFSYAGSTYKTALTRVAEDNNGSGSINNFVFLWRSTAAITSVSFLLSTTGMFAIGTTATLYGIKAA